MKYLVFLDKSGYGYSVSVPALPGCYSQGRTKKEALANSKDAILTYLAINQDPAEDTEIEPINVEDENVEIYSDQRIKEFLAEDKR